MNKKSRTVAQIQNGMTNIVFYFRGNSSNRNVGVIHMRFYIKRDKISFTTKVPADKKNWNAEKMKFTSGDSMFVDKNLILENIRARINDVIVRFKLRNKELTKKAFERAYNRPNDFDNFYSFCDSYQKQVVNKRVELPTLSTHKTALSKLKSYAPELHFDELTIDFITDYHKYLLRKIKNNENTAYKNMSVIRKYVNAACKAGYMDENPFHEFHILRTKANYTFLTEEEIRKLIFLLRNGELELKYYKTLQFFLFMCFGSQHISDAKGMKIEDFSGKTFVYWRLKLRNKKPEPIFVPISNILRELVRDIAGYRSRGILFEDIPADQTMNRYLKEIAKMVEIDKKISHKTGRHTFATYFLSKQPDLNTLKDIMGHSDIRETLIYAHVLERNKQRGIACFDELL